MVSLSIYENYFLWLGVVTIILGIIYSVVAKIVTAIANRYDI